MIRKLCIIGVGLIGGSLARAARRAGCCKLVVGAGRSETHLRRALEAGVIDRYATDMGRAVAGADMVVVAVPIGAMEDVFRVVAEHLGPQAIVTDVGSAKASVVAMARATLGDAMARFVPGHPIAGTEKSGVDASFGELFEGRRVILTPGPDTQVAAVARVRAMWERVGAKVVEMPVEHHDEVLAATSHLPHVLAYALVDTLARMEDKTEIFAFAAGGFRDFTRIASSDPTMWHDICVGNREAILAMLDRFGTDLERLTTAIRERDNVAILEIFNRAKTARDDLCQG